MEVSLEVRQSTVKYLLAMLEDIDNRKSILEERHEKTLSSLRQEKYSYTKILQDVCPHESIKNIDSWDYHNNVDDSYDTCQTCGKNL